MNLTQQYEAISLSLVDSIAHIFNLQNSQMNIWYAYLTDRNAISICCIYAYLDVSESNSC